MHTQFIAYKDKYRLAIVNSRLEFVTWYKEEKKMNLKKQIEKCGRYSGRPLKELPWEVRRVFPDIDIACTGISFSSGGDFVTTEEAVQALKYLLKELVDDSPI